MNMQGDSIETTAGIFDDVAGKWVISNASPEEFVCDTLTFATFNIWFGDHFAQERYQAIANLLEKQSPDFIALQEVTPDTLRSFLSQYWIQQGYFTSDIDGSTLGDYGIVILSRIPLERIAVMPLPSFMERDLLIAETEINGTQLHVATVHLESMKSSSNIRAAQLESIFETLKDAQNAVVLGDFNFCASWPEENDLIDSAYQDVWGLLRDNEPGYTEDTSINRMRYLVKGKHKHVRFDRILLKSLAQGAGWGASSIQLLGTEPISSEHPNVFPSDHFGLLCQISTR